MTARISNRNTFQALKQLIIVQRNINKCNKNLTSAYHTTYFWNRNEKNFNCLSQLKNSNNRPFLCTPPLLQIHFQKRNLSNEANVSEDFNNLSQTPPNMTTANDAIDALSSHVPSFLRNVSDLKIVQIAQDTLLKIHEITGLPWWASIALSAFLARTIVTFPISIIQTKNTVKLELISKEMNDIVKDLKQEANYAVAVHDWPEKLARKKYQLAVKKKHNELIVRDNCHPAKSFILIWVQLPLWFSFSIATRNLCYMLPKPDINAQWTFAEISVGGFGWVTNLAACDAYLILPVTLALMNLSILEVHNLFRTTPLTKFDKWKTYFFRGISVVMIPIAASLPAATNIYWLTSSFFGLIQAFLLHSVRLHRLCKIPITKSELEHPYRYFYGKLKSKLHLT